MIKDLFIVARVECLKLGKLKIAATLLAPILIDHVIVIFNSILQNLPLDRTRAASYALGVMGNWYVFLMIFSTIYLCHQYWRNELETLGWHKTKMYPIPLIQFFVIKQLILFVLILIQGLLLASSARVLYFIPCTGEPSCTAVLTSAVVDAFAYAGSLLPAVVITSWCILWLKRIELISGFAALLAITHLFLSDHESIFLSPWSWPYLIAVDRFNPDQALITIAIFALIRVLALKGYIDDIQKFMRGRKQKVQH